MTSLPMNTTSNPPKTDTTVTTNSPKTELPPFDGKPVTNSHGSKEFSIHHNDSKVEIKDFDHKQGDKINLDFGNGIKSVDDLLKHLTNTTWNGDDLIFEVDHQNTVTIKNAKTNGVTVDDLNFKTTDTTVTTNPPKTETEEPDNEKEQEHSVYITHDKIKGTIQGTTGTSDTFIVDTTTNKTPIEIKDFHHSEKDKLHLNTGLGIKTVDELASHLKNTEWIGDDLHLTLDNQVDITIVGARTNGIDVSDLNILG